MAEALRDRSEQERTRQEETRVKAEGSRDSAEQERMTNERKRVEEEAARKEEESKRVQSERERAEAETVRETAEGLRETAERARKTAEGMREQQETSRQENTAVAVANAEAATQDANDAADRANAAAEAAEGVVSGLQPDWNISDPVNKNYIKNKPEIPTLDMVPTADTLSYVNIDGTTINFRIGDEVRVLENGEYVFYRLYDLADGIASWQESGGGTALPGNVYLTGANYYNDSVRTIKQGYLSHE